MTKTIPIHEFHETLLRVEKVYKSIDDTPILRDVSFEIRNVVQPDRPDIRRGQVYGLLGPSGVGKTQLFRILAGLSRPTSGSVLLHAEGRPVHTGEVGVVSQNYILFMHRTVLGNLLLAGRQAGLPSDQARSAANAYLEQFGLIDKGEAYPAQLSGGQRQRVAIIQQLMCSDHFLLMDEPFSGLDVLMLEKVCEVIRTVTTADELNTVIVVTHDVTAAALVADHLLLMGRDRDAQGRIIPGARIMRQFDLISEGFAWRDGLQQDPDFLKFVSDVKLAFRTL